jgi:hypothetical protein
MASTRTRALARTWRLGLAGLFVPLHVLGAFGTMNLDTSTDPWCRSSGPPGRWS